MKKPITTTASTFGPFTLELIARELRNALDIASTVTDTGIKSPVLKTTRIEVVNGAATFIATNTDHSIRASAPASGSGVVHLDTAMLAQKASALRQDQPVKLQADDEGKFVTITQGKTRWKLPVILGEGFPIEVADRLAAEPVTIPADQFFAALNSISRMVNQADERMIGRGVYLDMADGVFRVIACSGSGMAVMQLDCPLLANDIILPNEAVRAILSIFKEADVLAVTVTPNAITVEHDICFYRSRLAEGTYANWRQARDMQSAKLNGSMTVETGLFISTMARATAIGEEKTKSGSGDATRFAFAGNECAMHTRNRVGEEGDDICEYAGDDGSFAASAGAIRNAIESIGTQTISLTINTGEDGPVMIKPEPIGDLENYRIVMGMRV